MQKPDAIFAVLYDVSQKRSGRDEDMRLSNIVTGIISFHDGFVDRCEFATFDSSTCSDRY